MRKPRPFSHSPIYINDRKARLAEIEERARRELGLAEPRPYSGDELQGVFSSVQRHRKGRGWRWNTQSLLMALTVLVVLLLLVLL